MQAIDLRNAISKLVPLEDVAWQALEEYLSVLPVKKFDHLWRINEICRHIVFIKKGILRSYYINNKKEVTLRFFTEHSIVVAYQSFITQLPTFTAFQALEDAELINSKPLTGWED